MKNLLFTIILIFSLNLAYAQGNQWLWASNTISYHHGGAVDLGTDDNGNIFQVGYFSDSICIFGNDTVFGDLFPAYNTYIVKYTPSGSVIWAKSFAGGVIYPYSIAVRPDGNIYIAGSFDADTLMLDSIILPSTQTWLNDIFVASFDSSGNIQWANRFGSNGSDIVTDIDFDSQGSLYITGNFSGSQLSVGSLTFNNAGSYSFFIVKFDSTGNLFWAQIPHGFGDSFGEALSIDEGDNAYICVKYTGTVIFQNDTLFGADFICILKLNNIGNLKWYKQYYGSFQYSKLSVRHGEIFIGGVFTSQDIDIGGVVIHDPFSSSLNTYELFIAKIDTSGNTLWAKAGGSEESDEITDIDIDRNGNMFISGSFNSGWFRIDTLILTNPSPYPGNFIIGFDNTGAAIYGENFPGDVQDHFNSLAIDPFNNIIVTGDFFEGLTFGNISLFDGTPGWDSFIAKSSGTIVKIPEIVMNDQDFILKNPSDGNVMINIPKKVLRIKLYNSSGQLVKEFAVKELNMFNFYLENPGIYFMELIGETKRISKKIVVIKN